MYANRVVLWRFGKLFLPLALVLASIFFWIGHVHRQGERILIAETETRTVAMAQAVIRQDFAGVVADLRILADSPELQRVLSDPRRSFAALTAEYVAVSRRKGLYDQVRFLDHTGMERVRVNFASDRPVVVPTADLQNKGKRYFFRDTFQIDPGKVFVSPFDLNIEQDAIEVPHKPMIRFGVPVVDAAGRKRGIVLLNYFGATLLANLARAASHAAGSVMLLNAEGHWLKGERTEDEWGFMFPDRRERTFAYAFPEAWAQIQKHETGQFWTAAGLFTFTTVRPLDPTQVSSTGSFRAFAPSTTRVGADTYRWIVVSRVSPVVLSARLAGRVHGLPSLALGMLGILAAGTALLAGMGEKRRRAEAALRESEAFQRTLLEQLPVGVAVVDAASGVVERVNRATAALVGEPVERLLGRAWGAWLKGGAARRAGGPPGPSLGGAGEGLLVRADGTEIPVLTAVACLPERGRETLLASIVDLTAQRQAEAARAEVERLQGAMEAAGAAAHALNQPLQVLSGHLQLLELRSEETVSRESLRSMMAQIERMGQTTTALASITRYATMPYVGTQQILDIERAAAAESRRLDVLEWMTDGCDGRAQTTAEELHV